MLLVESWESLAVPCSGRSVATTRVFPAASPLDPLLALSSDEPQAARASAEAAAKAPILIVVRMLVLRGSSVPAGSGHRGGKLPARIAHPARTPAVCM